MANDPRELNIGYQAFVDALDIVRQRDFPGDNGKFLDHLAHLLGSHRDLSHVFCACFSLSRDELPMWGTYGGNHTGLSIGFRPAAFLGTPGRMQRVKYIDTRTVDDLSVIIGDIAKGLAPNTDSDMQRILSASEILGTITQLKHKSWSYEREFRMILMQPKEPDDVVKETSLFPDKTPFLWSKPLERPGRLGAINYLELPFGKFNAGKFDYRRAIKQVVIGPNSALSETEMRAALADNGFEEVVIETSECQIRSR
jgi:hypothetical protein